MLTNVTKISGSSRCITRSKYNCHSIVIRHFTIEKIAVSTWEKKNFSYWNNVQNHRLFFDWLATKLAIKKTDDWYHIKRNDVERYGGSQLLHTYYSNSFIKGDIVLIPLTYSAVSAVYPSLDWKLWKFTDISQSFWSDKQCRRKYFDQIADITKPEDWYKVKLSDITTESTKDCLKRLYNNSLFQLLSDVYPEYSWDIWRFQDATVPKGYWENPTNQRQCLESIAKQLGMKSLQDWYHVNRNILLESGAVSLLHLHNNSLVQGECGESLFIPSALRTIYPDFNWDVNKFKNVPRNHWKDVKNQRKFFDDLAEELNITRPEDWYAVPRDAVVARGGIGVLDHHGDSLIKGERRKSEDKMKKLDSKMIKN